MEFEDLGETSQKPDEITMTDSDSNQNIQKESLEIDPEKFDEYAEELYEEARQINKELRQYKSAFFSQLDKEIYLVNKLWFRQWKQFVIFKQVKRGYQLKYQRDQLEQDYPGRINNEELLKNTDKYLRDDNPDDPTNFAVKSKIREGVDFKLLPKKCWKLLEKRFGGKEIVRYKDPDLFNRRYVIRLPAIPVLILPPYDQIAPGTIFPKQKLYMETEQKFSWLKEKLIRCLNQRSTLKLNEDSVRLWKCSQEVNNPQRVASFLSAHSIGGPETKFVSNTDDPDIEENTGVKFPGIQFDSFLNKTYKEVDKSMNMNYQYDLMVVETATQEGQFIFKYNKNPGTYGKCENCYDTGMLKITCACKKVAYCNESCKTKDERYHLNNCDAENVVDFGKLNLEKMPNAKRGVVGLYNMGNTCYMNSALQCLSNTWPLSQYFLEKHFINEINYDNPLGTQGALVFHYAKLLNELWNKESDVFSPSLLKRVIGKQNSMFQGNNQHDSQEFLNFLLDTLHEDLNRVQKKPYVELSDSNNRPDQVVAYEYWQGHLKRNQSIIVDLMQGQYKSTLQCPTCKKVSITFDPYMSVPLPIPVNFQCQYYFLPYNVRTKIYKYDIFIKMSDTMLDVKKQIAQQASEYYKYQVSPYEFIMAQIDKHDFSISQLFQDNMPSSLLNVNYNQYFVFAYQINKSALNYQVLPQVDAQQSYEIINGSTHDGGMDEETKHGEKIHMDMEEQSTDEKAATGEIGLKYIPLEDIILNDWIQIPVQPAIRHLKQQQYSYSSYNHNKYESKQVIPRLFWFHKDHSLFDVFKQIITQYSFAQDSDSDEHDSDKFFEDHYEKVIYQLANGVSPDQIDFGLESTEFPMVVNLLNPFKTYYAPVCRNCGQRTCKNCALKVSNNLTVRDLLTTVAHTTKFKDNANLFVNAEQLKDQQNDSDEEVKDSWNSGNKYKGNIQGGSDDDDEGQNKDKEMKVDNVGRHKTIVLEIVFVNRVIKTSVSSISSKLLGFDHHPREQKASSSMTKSRPQKSAQNIKDCLEYFRQTEKLEKENSWYCSQCKDHVEATKKLELYTVPPVLILCLQRFKSHNNYFKEKLEDRINFPINNLDMSPYVLNEELKSKHSMLYDLVAVSNHSGTLSFGHYTAYCKNFETGQWYDYNDSSVSEVDNPLEIVSPMAYVLYYIRKDFYPDKQIDFDAIKIQLEGGNIEVPPQQQQVQVHSQISQKKDLQSQENEISQANNNSWQELHNSQDHEDFNIMTLDEDAAPPMNNGTDQSMEYEEPDD